MTETKQGPKRKWFYRMAAFSVLGVAVADKRTWKELKPLVQNGLADAWKAKVAEIMAGKGVSAPPKPQPAPQAPTTAPSTPSTSKPRAPAARKPSGGTTIAPTTTDEIRAQLAAASAAISAKAA